MQSIRETFLRQSIKHINIFNYILVLVLAVWLLNNSFVMGSKVPTSSWILIECFVVYAVLYTAICRVYRGSAVALRIIAYVSYIICLSFVTLTIYVTKDMYGIFYLLLIPLIEFRHTFRTVGMMVLSFCTVGTYIYAMQDTGTAISLSMWLDFAAGFVIFLIYIVHTIISISSSEVDQYTQRRKAEEVSNKIQNEKEIMELMYDNVRSLTNTLDVGEIANRVNEVFSQLVWQKKLIFVSLHPQQVGQFQYYCFQGQNQVDDGLNGSEYDFIKRVLREKNVVYEQNACGLPLRSAENVIGAVILIDSLEGSVSNDFQLIYTLCEQISPILNNALKYYTKEMESITDGMTKVYNKRYFQQTLGKLMELAPENLYLILYDIDHFKKFNDTYGHTFGDTVLIETARVVQNTLRENDFLARYGGEEFAILFESPSDEIALKVANRVRENVESNLIYNKDIDTNLSVTISVGVGKYVSPWSQIDFIDAVDQALYKCKENGRNCTSLARTEVA